MPEKDLFTETESKDFVCVPKVCKGFCCENISSEVAENLQKLGLPMESNGNGEFRCFLHDKETGLCNEYERRTWYCKSFFCPSASRGFMAKLKEDLEKDWQKAVDIFQGVVKRENSVMGKQVKIQYVHKGCGGVIFHHGNRPLDKPIKRKYQDICGKCGKKWDYGDEQEPDIEVREVLV